MDSNSEILKEDSSPVPEDNYKDKLTSFEENNTSSEAFEKNSDGKLIALIVPLVIIFFLLSGFTVKANLENPEYNDNGFTEFGLSTIEHSRSEVNILSESDLSTGIKDTVYTEKECWLELRIDQQTLYQHWRNGKTEKYLISSGNKYLSKGVESRPGLFAIFAKEPHHESTQFNNAVMFYFMPFDMGIGFHALAGTGYYGSLGVTPVSHGCIRMRHQDVEKVFKDCPLGTLVLAHRGYTSRTVGFAPKDYVSNENFSKDEYKLMLAENLMNILEGNYYLKERKFFIVDPKVIPTFGIYISYDKKIPDKQKLKNSNYKFSTESDRLRLQNDFRLKTDESLKADENLYYTESKEKGKNSAGNKDDNVLTEQEIIKKYFHNPIGILPYFPPNK